MRASERSKIISALKRADEATDGPWTVGEPVGDDEIAQATRFGTLRDPDDASEPGVYLGDAHTPDAVFIVNARTEHPAFARALLRIRDRIDSEQGKFRDDIAEIIDSELEELRS